MTTNNIETIAYTGARLKSGRCAVVHTSRIGDDLFSAPLDNPVNSSLAYSWGDTTDGSQQLAFSMISHATGKRSVAAQHAYGFARMIIAKLPPEGWTLTHQAVLEAIDHG